MNRAIPLQMQLSSGGTPITDANIAGAPPVVNVTFSAGGGPAVDVTGRPRGAGSIERGKRVLLCSLGPVDLAARDRSPF